MSVCVLIADDEPAIVMAVQDELAFEGFDVHAAGSGPEALMKARTLRPDILLLDLMLPGKNGFDVCRELRGERPDLWIIMLTVRGQEVDRVTGFEVGADDYVIKPFSLRELVGRMKGGVKRVRPATVRQPRRVAGMTVDVAARRVTRDGRDVDLTPKEFDILDLLIRRAGTVVTRDEFLDAIWGADVHVTPRTVDTHVASLRRKIEPNPNRPTHIVGVRSLGYRFEQAP